MSIEEQLRDKLEKVEALYFGAGTAGEKNAAEAAIERLRARLAEISRRDPPVEMQFSMPDPWAVRLFVALMPPLRNPPLPLSPAEADDGYGARAARVLQ